MKLRYFMPEALRNCFLELHSRISINIFIIIIIIIIISIIISI
jgi:hypothetical protein